MDYLIAYLEGVLSFASPCLLPMLPIYLSYFSARQTRKAAMLRVAAFTAGIAAVFCSMGALAGLMGRLLIRYATALNLVCGALMVALGLSRLAGQGLPGLSKLSFLQPRASVGMGMLSSFLLGAALSLVWTPCIGAFLGSALLLAATAGSTAKGIGMLLCYSLGLGSPIAICAALVSQSAAGVAVCAAPPEANRPCLRPVFGGGGHFDGGRHAAGRSRETDVRRKP